VPGAVAEVWDNRTLSWQLAGITASANPSSLAIPQYQGNAARGLLNGARRLVLRAESVGKRGGAATPAEVSVDGAAVTLDYELPAGL
jgi:hypothetical protein